MVTRTVVVVLVVVLLVVLLVLVVVVVVVVVVVLVTCECAAIILNRIFASVHHFNFKVNNFQVYKHVHIDHQ